MKQSEEPFLLLTIRKSLRKDGSVLSFLAFCERLSCSISVTPGMLQVYSSVPEWVSPGLTGTSANGRIDAIFLQFSGRAKRKRGAAEMIALVGLTVLELWCTLPLAPEETRAPLIVEVH
jgi:hypothetical protein